VPCDVFVRGGVGEGGWVVATEAGEVYAVEGAGYTAGVGGGEMKQPQCPAEHRGIPFIPCLDNATVCALCDSHWDNHVPKSEFQWEVEGE